MISGVVSTDMEKVVRDKIVGALMKAGIINGDANSTGGITNGLATSDGPVVDILVFLSKFELNS